MIVAKLTKETADITRLVVDLSKWLDPVEVITSVTTPVVSTDYSCYTTSYNSSGITAPLDITPLTVGTPSLTDGATTITLMLHTGTPGLRYIVEFDATGGSGRVRTIDVQVTISQPAYAAFPLSVGAIPLTGAMTGPLILFHDPVLPLEAATKGYVDGADVLALPLVGGTLTGPLVLAGAPTTALSPATKAYVDAGDAALAAGGVSVTATGTSAARTLADRFADTVNAKDQGVKGDGATDDYAALTALIEVVRARGGGTIYLPPTGKYYRLTHGLSLPNCVRLLGAGAFALAGFTATTAQWAAQGTWLLSEDTVNPTVTLQGHGSCVDGVGFLRNQTVPSGTFVPVIFPYEIKLVGDFCCIDHVMMVGASHGINVDFGASGGGVGCRVANAVIDACVIGLRTDNVNDVMRLENIHVRGMWYVTNALRKAYDLANKIGWDCHYCDNPIVDGFEVLYGFRAIFLTDATCQGNTHSLYNATINGFQFNLVRQFLTVAATTTTVRASFADAVMQTVSDTPAFTDHALQLGSDNVRVSFTNTRCNSIATVLMDLGAGTGGVAIFAGLDGVYDSLNTGASCFSLAAGSTLILSGERITTPGSGALYGGAGTLTRFASQSGAGIVTAPTGVTIGSGTMAAEARVVLNAAAGFFKDISCFTGGLLRWVFGSNNAAETGSNVGSDFNLLRYDDTGAQIDTPFRVLRSNGRTFMSGGVSISGGASSTIDGATIGGTTPAAITGTSIRTLSTAGPTWTAGTGAPAATQPVGSLFSRTDGAVGTTLYVSRGGGTWNPVAGV